VLLTAGAGEPRCRNTGQEFTHMLVLNVGYRRAIKTINISSV